MKNEKYKDINLTLFRLNEKGEPLALPWIEQEPILLEWFLNNLGEPLNSVRVFSVKIQSTLIDDFRSFYQSPFDLSTDLTGEKAIFVGEIEHDCCGGNEGHTCDGCDHSRGWLYAFRTDSGSVEELHCDEWEYHPAEGEARHFPIKPETKGDFISDCHRAGIPLVWTPYAIRKLTAQNV